MTTPEELMPDLIDRIESAAIAWRGWDVERLLREAAAALTCIQAPSIGDADKQADAGPWCQPMEKGKHTRRRFLVRFDDTERGEAVFDDEGEAREYWEKADTHWNCYLFGALPLYTHPSQLPPADKQADGLVERLNEETPSEGLVAFLDDLRARSEWHAARHNVADAIRLQRSARYIETTYAALEQLHGPLSVAALVAVPPADKQADGEQRELEGDARTLRGYIKEFGETPSMTASRASIAEARLAVSERERDEALEKANDVAAAWSRDAEFEALEANVLTLTTALSELADLMDDVLAGNYMPDSFTTQPARAAIEQVSKAGGGT